MAIRDKEFYKRMNRVIEKLAKCNLSGTDFRYCLVIFRKTFGYGKYEDRISGRQIADLTGILEVNVSRARKRLKDRRIINTEGYIKGFNLNTNEWETLSKLISIKRLSNPISKVINRAEKKVINSDNYKETTKKLSKEGGEVLEKLGLKEVEKLEGKKWLKQVMWQRGKFSIKFIDQVFSSHKFMKLYNTYLALQDAYNVRDKEAWFLARLERETDPEE